VTADSIAKKAPIGTHAIVLGASVAGLLAARVLADFYATVTVVERDTLGEHSGRPKGRAAGSPYPWAAHAGRAGVGGAVSWPP